MNNRHRILLWILFVMSMVFPFYLADFILKYGMLYFSMYLILEDALRIFGLPFFHFSFDPLFPPLIYISIINMLFGILIWRLEGTKISQKALVFIGILIGQFTLIIRTWLFAAPESVISFLKQLNS